MYLFFARKVFLTVAFLLSMWYNPTINAYQNSCRAFSFQDSQGFEAIGGVVMAKCDICGKSVAFGIKVSHSHRRSNRVYRPNIQRVKAVVNGSPKHVYACTRCLRSGKVQRAV